MLKKSLKMLMVRISELRRILSSSVLIFIKTFEAKSIKAEVTDSSQLSQLDKSGLTTEHVEVAEEETDVKDVKPEPGKVFCNLKAKNSKEEEEGGNDDSTPVYK